MSAERPKLTPRPPDPPPPDWAADPEGLLRTRPGSVKAALTGGIASGKSVVSELLAALGANRCGFDELCRRVVAKGTEGLAEVAKLFGPKSLTAEGELDRALMAKLVFKDAGARQALEAVIHPAAWKTMLECLAEDAASVAQPGPLTVIEVPLLYEASLASLFKPVILSFCHPQTQLKRLKERDRLNRWAARRRLAAQIPILDKIRRADVIIDNDGSLVDVIRQCRAHYPRLCQAEHWT
jgi:dephospho-CoA kinase